jgi:hypothetical protein
MPGGGAAKRTRQLRASERGPDEALRCREMIGGE